MAQQKNMYSFDLFNDAFSDAWAHWKSIGEYDSEAEGSGSSGTAPEKK